MSTARTARVASLCCLALWIVGCGSNSPGGDPPAGATGRLTGNLGREAAGGTVQLDGTTLTGAVSADGSFTLDGVPSGEYTLAVTGADGSGAAILVRVAPDATTTVPPLDLQPAGQIAGLISSANRPLAGARVTARLLPYYDEYLDGLPAPLLEAAAAAPAGRQTGADLARRRPPRVAVTGANGSFLFTGVVPGLYSLEVSADAHETGTTGVWVEAGRTATADLSLVRIDPNNATVVGTISGRTADGTLPLAQVRVDLWPLDGAWPEAPMAAGGGDRPSPPANPGVPAYDNPWTVPPFWYAKTAFTDEHGRYAIRNIPPGRYQFSLRREGYAVSRQTVTLAARSTITIDQTLDWILALLRGRVLLRTEAGLAPAVGIFVAAFTTGVDTDESSPGGIINQLRAGRQRQADGDEPVVLPAPGEPGVRYGYGVTGPDGSFELETEAGEVTILTWAYRYQFGELNVTVPRSGLDGVELILEPMPAATVSLTGPDQLAVGQGGTFAFAIQNDTSDVIRVYGPPHARLAVFGPSGDLVWAPVTILDRPLGRQGQSEPGSGGTQGMPWIPVELAPGESVEERLDWPGTNLEGQFVSAGWYQVVGRADTAVGETAWRNVAVGSPSGPAPTEPPAALTDGSFWR